MKKLIIKAVNFVMFMLMVLGACAIDSSGAGEKVAIACWIFGSIWCFIYLYVKSKEESPD